MQRPHDRRNLELTALHDIAVLGGLVETFQECDEEQRQRALDSRRQTMHLTEYNAVLRSFVVDVEREESRHVSQGSKAFVEEARIVD
jgi:hypothetical protein